MENSPPPGLSIAPTLACLDNEALPQRELHTPPLDPNYMNLFAFCGGIFCVYYISRVQRRSLPLTAEEKAAVSTRLHLALAAYSLSVAAVVGLFHLVDAPAEWSLAFVPSFVAALGQHGVNGALEGGRRRSLALRGPLWELEGAPKAPTYFWMFMLLMVLNTALLVWLGVN